MVTLTAQPGAVEIDLARTALIVVDMQNAYLSKGGMLDLAGMDVSGARPVIEAHQRILPAVREAGVRVIYLQFGYKADLSDAGGPESPNYNRHLALRMLRENPDYREQLIIENTWGWEIVDELKPEPRDVVVHKPRFSGFTSTSLESILRSAGIQYLLFTGVATNICVESTARDAYFAEFWPILIEDALNHSGPDFNRDATLWNFEYLFGWVSDTEKLLSALGTRESEPKPP